nr:DUF805 domain-containing protein [Micrococcus sp. ACRRV]
MDVFILGSPDLSLRGVAVLLVGITHALPSLALLARRLHDAGFSHAWLFLGLVPFVGPLTLLVFALQPSAASSGFTDSGWPVTTAISTGAKSRSFSRTVSPVSRSTATSFWASASVTSPVSSSITLTSPS